MIEVERHEHVAHSLSADTRLERIVAILFLRLEEVLLGQKLSGLQRRQARFDDHVVLEIEHALKVLQPHIEQKANARRQ